MSVALILSEVWNPIGGDLPWDEYEHYEQRAEALAKAGDQEGIVSYLMGIEQVNDWDDYGSKARAWNVADLLIAEAAEALETR